MPMPPKPAFPAGMPAKPTMPPKPTASKLNFPSPSAGIKLPPPMLKTPSTPVVARTPPATPPAHAPVMRASTGVPIPSKLPGIPSSIALPPKPAGVNLANIPPPKFVLPPKPTGAVGGIPAPLSGASLPAPLSPAAMPPPPMSIVNAAGEKCGPSDKEILAATLTLQRAVRGWKQRKSYKELYEKRRWTLHKEAKVLTNHVTKSRVSGRPGRRPPTRGKRPVGLAKPTYEPTKVQIPEDAPGSASPSLSRPKSMIGGGMNFDPSKVKLKATGSLDGGQVMSAPNSPAAGRARPVSMIATTLTQSDSATPTGGMPPKPIGGMPPKPIGGMPGKPSHPPNFPLVKQLSGMPTLPGKDNSSDKKGVGVFMTVSQDSQDDLPPTLPPPSPVVERKEAPQNPEVREKKKRVGKILNNWLTRRPPKEELIANGVLPGDGSSSALKNSTSGDNTPSSLPEMKRPVMLTSGKQCMNYPCKKTKKANCHRCGRIFCKNCIHGKIKLPELQYTKPVAICTTCYNERKNQLKGN